MATRRTTTVLVTGFAALALLSMLVTGVFSYLLAGDPRVVVVAMKTGAGQAAREQLRRDCGGLPGIRPVPDRGNPNPAVQGRFPVRFRLAGAGPREEAALERCIARHTQTVLGVSIEGGN